MQTETKNAIRIRMLKRLRSQKKEERLEKSAIIMDKLFSTPQFKRSKTILFYASFDGEVETFDMMKQAKKLGKKIALPAIIRKQKKLVPILVEDFFRELTDGPYGIKQPLFEGTEPLPLEMIDLAVVPGVAFDRRNNRLGRGAGYYDRFLARLSSAIPTLGLAFDFQILERLPHQNRRDIPVSGTISN